MATHGITSSTTQRLFIDAGAVYKNYGESGETLLGATRGGNQFKIETEIRTMEFDGAHGPVKGAERIVGHIATITANFVEITEEVLLLSLPGATAADYPDTPSKTHDLITRAADIASGDYITNIAIVGKNTQSSTNDVICVVENALSDGNLELGFTDKDESVMTVTFKAHFDAADLTTEPWKIYNPCIA